MMEKQKGDIDRFGANSWFVEYLSEQVKANPEALPAEWQPFFGVGEKAAKSPLLNEAYPAPLNTDEIKQLTGGPSKIVANMEASLSIPTAASQRVLPVKLLEENRTLINSFLGKTGGRKISFTHIIAWAVVQSVRRHPVMNSAFFSKDGKQFKLNRKHINLGIAIDIEKKDGSRSLLVPNLRSVEEMGFSAFVSAYDALVSRARTGTIDPSEFAGSTITLTNPGTLGTVASQPRLMLGQGAIIATGAIQYPAEYQAMSPESVSNLGISKVLTVTSTYDHRIIQGAESGLFLQTLHSLLLGGDEFYQSIFTDLKIPRRPIAWLTDNAAAGSAEINNLHEIEKQAKVLQLINMYRVRGHLVARIDPLGKRAEYHAELDPPFHGLTLWDYDRVFITGGFASLRTATLRQILEKLQNTYCEHIGVEYMHIQNHEEKAWLQQKMEPYENRPQFDAGIKKRIIQKLIHAEAFENFIHTKFIGHKRFSLEGSESIIPQLDYLLFIAANSDIREAVIGMAHRGRLNVLVNILGKSHDSIFSEFEDIVDRKSIGGSGDVKYHLGASGKVETMDSKIIDVTIATNPSHLEFVNPVVEGIVRAKQTRRKDSAHREILPLLLHGDAAFAGQGVVAETLNLSQLRGYRTGGTVHIIINNQIGFTTTPEDARSTEYATDVARMVQAPIFHVNGEEPESVLWATELALDFRTRFHKDVVIDVLGYRRHGHNEGDEPGFTQPILYKKIKERESVAKLYISRCMRDGFVSQQEIDAMKEEYTKKLDSALARVKKKHFEFQSDLPLAVPKEKLRAYKNTDVTAISEKLAKQIVEALTKLPEGFTVHPKLKTFLQKRAEFSGDAGSADWGLAESLAFGSLLLEGTSIRLSGQDSVRGTFSHRHLSLTDVNTGEEYFPINHIAASQSRIEALDSFLSEAAVLGFEFGYSIADPLALVLWEAQFGDFANGAQVIIDNFIVASNEKWQTPNNLVMLLPHGFEGQGPEHSSARIERFLTLCAEENMEVCNPSTPAQYFHLLRRHIKKGIRRPLIIFTPKSLLRHPDARSVRQEFTSGTFLEILDDAAATNKQKAKRVILTSGKIYYELLKYRAENKLDETAIVRIEQYYPFEDTMLKSVLATYSKAVKFCWVQEEPQNMGAWNFLAPRIRAVLKQKQELHCFARPAAASPAVGSAKLSVSQQQHIIESAFRQ